MTVINNYALELVKAQIKTRPWLAYDLNENGTVNDKTIDIRMALVQGIKDASFYEPYYGGISLHGKTDEELKEEAQTRLVVAECGISLCDYYDLPLLADWFRRQMELWTAHLS
jgi:hypothetical protein